jgi:predicted metal-dependent hydrolase
VSREARRKSHEGQERKRPAIGKINRGLPSNRCAEEPPPELLRGIEEFNRGEFFEQHETLEEIWIEESDPVRYLYQGILQVGVGFYHRRRNNFRGATLLLERGVGYLEPFRPACLGVDIESLVVAAREALDEIRRLGPEKLPEFDESRFVPKVQLITG